MFKTLKKEDPKTYIILLIMITFLVLAGVACMIYLTAMTKYEGYHIGFAIAGGFLLFISLLLLIHTGVNVSGLKTKLDWEEERKEGLEKQKYKLETTKYAIILEKLKSNEVLTTEESHHLKNIEVEFNKQE